MDEKQLKPLEIHRFTSPEEELRFLREQVAAKENELEILKSKETKPREAFIKEEVSLYKEKNTEDILLAERVLRAEKMEQLAVGLKPETHDIQVKELISILEKEGIKNTLGLLQKMNNPHLEDDFHRFLIQYIKKGMPVSGMKTQGPLWDVLHMTLYEISLPQREASKERSIKELLSGMEQFYSGMLFSSHEESRHFTFEIALSDLSDEIIFYAAVSNQKRDLFEKQMHAINPETTLREQKNDYNVFVGDGFSAGARGALSVHDIFPLKTYEAFENDPLHVLLNAFSKIETEGGGAAIQFVFKPDTENLTSYYREVIKKITEGVSLKDALNTPRTLGGELLAEAVGIIFGKSSKQKEEKKEKIIDQALLGEMQKKIESRIALINIRVISSAKSKERGEEILSHLESAFNQFDNAKGNRISFSRLGGDKLSNFLKEFSFREFSEKNALSLNIKEIATLIHPPEQGLSHAQVKQSKTGSAQAPLAVPKVGMLLGVNRFREQETKIHITNEDRLRHFYVIGQTGTGKTTLLKNMIAQDIKAGEGVCMIDPHGTDMEDVLGMIPESRFEDVIYFDPSHTERVMALNMLEYDPRFPEQKTFVVNELFSIFQKLYAGTPEAMGPVFEQYFRNATQLVMEDPETGNTLLDVSRVLADARYRAVKLAACKNPVVSQFWREIATKAGGDQSLQNMVPYITSKFDIFAANDYMRPIIAQQKSTFNFRKIMDERKILLVNLAKGRLGDINSNLIGLILVGKILMAALSRVDTIGQGDPPPFYLYIDEFQNVTTDSIAVILSEARKYKLSLTVAHQFIAQLDQKIQNAVFGNVGSFAAFRVGASDAETLEKQFAPTFTAKDLMNIENRNAYIRLLANGEPLKPFNIVVLPPQESNREKASVLKKQSFEKYGRPREEIEAAIMRRYNPTA